MAKKKIELTFDEILEKAVEATAEDVALEVEKAYEEVIELFYKSYTPRNNGPYRYKRTKSTFYGSSGYDTLYSSNNIYRENDIYITGIDVSPEFMRNNPLGYNPYRADLNSPAWVFWRTFDQGIHGFTAEEAKQWSKKTHINRHGMVSKFKMPKRIPTKMKESPKVLMDKKFKEISSIENLNKIFNKNFKRFL